MKSKVTATVNVTRFAPLDRDMEFRFQFKTLKLAERFAKKVVREGLRRRKNNTVFIYPARRIQSVVIDE